jgi:hypothetical protein
MRARSAPAYRRRFHVHFPEALAEAVEHSADAKMTSVNSWIRQACLLALAKETTERREHEMHRDGLSAS